MNRSFYLTLSFFIVIGLTWACGSDGGCGGQQQANTQPQLTCGRGTHQEGKECVRNAQE